ncbi:hypothetical protein [Pelagihabitans pacificus]|nr:hypothetical protein [Pelagihabitans pacificus]
MNGSKWLLATMEMTKTFALFVDGIQSLSSSFFEVTLARIKEFG